MAIRGYLDRALGRQNDYQPPSDPVEVKIEETGMAVVAPVSAEITDSDLSDETGEWLGGQTCDLERWR